MSVIRVCFLGTPDFAAKHLQQLLNDDHYEVIGVVTQPDRPAGRKMQLHPSPVKVLALAKGLPVINSENLRKDPEAMAIIHSWRAEIAIVVAYGQILSQEFLDSFEFGAVNVHGSLLPKWRGAAPIQRSIEAGDLVTGVSLQKIVRKLDAGAVIGERRVTLNDDVTATELYDQLALLGCDLLHIELMDYIRGNLAPIEQDESQVTVAPKIEKEESLIQWNQPARKIHNKVRAFTMGPGTFVMFQGKRLKIFSTKVTDVRSTGPAGQIESVSASELIMQTSEGLISLIEVQPESKSKILIADFLKTVSLKKGDSFV